MAIDLNNNGKDDIEEVLEEMGGKFDELKESIESMAQDAVGNIENAAGIDIDGDGVVGE